MPNGMMPYADELYGELTEVLMREWEMHPRLNPVTLAEILGRMAGYCISMAGTEHEREAARGALLTWADRATAAALTGGRA